MDETRTIALQHAVTTHCRPDAKTVVDAATENHRWLTEVDVKRDEVIRLAGKIANRAQQIRHTCPGVTPGVDRALATLVELGNDMARLLEGGDRG